MEELFVRGWYDLIGREHGPLTFRLIVQPLVAAMLAVRSGLLDARNDRPPFLWAVLLHPTHRYPMLRHAWEDLGKLFLVAIVLDVIYQLMVFHWEYVGQTLIVAVVLAVVPYVVVRGLTNRIAIRLHFK